MQLQLYKLFLDSENPEAEAAEFYVEQWAQC